jgi:hypothetical protein
MNTGDHHHPQAPQAQQQGLGGVLDPLILQNNPNDPEPKEITKLNVMKTSNHQIPLIRPLD